MQKVLIALIKVYRFSLSPFIGQHCRFTPTCSQYAMEAIETHGAIKGSWMAAKRLSKCHPFHEGGWDPVPQCGCHTHGSHQAETQPPVTKEQR